MSKSKSRNKSSHYPHASLLKGTDAIHAKSVDGLHITNNLFLTPNNAGIEKLIKIQECNDTIIKGNIVHETDY